jgi:hypothetical protein
MKTNRLYILLGLVLLVALTAGLALAQGSRPQAPVGSAFAYQGRLTDTAGSPIDDTCDFRFSLWDDDDDGSRVGSAVEVPGKEVVGGLFTAQLDFGSVFDGTALWLEVEVQCSSDADYVPLDPRQPLTPTPYTLHAINADTLDGLHASSLARIGRYSIPGGGGTIAIPFPHYNTFQVTLGEAFGSPTKVGWMSGIENDGDLAWLAIDSTGAVSTGTCDLSTSTATILTLGANITLKCPGNGNLELTLTSSTEDVRVFVIW